MSLPRLKKRAQFLRVMKQGRIIKTRTMIVQVLDRKTRDKKTDASLQTNALSSQIVSRETIEGRGDTMGQSDRLSVPPIQIGFTASRRVGGAVVRNRARRRMRAMAEEILPGHCGDCDIVLIARSRLITESFDVLKEDCLYALRQVYAS